MDQAVSRWRLTAEASLSPYRFVVDRVAIGQITLYCTSALPWE